MSWFRLLVSRLPIFGGAVNCMMCFGFWVGVILSFILNSPVELLLDKSNGQTLNQIINPVLTGFISSGFSWMVYVLDNYLFSKSSSSNSSVLEDEKNTDFEYTENVLKD